MSLDSVLSLASSALRSTNARLDTTMRNISAADVPGATTHSRPMRAFVAGDATIAVLTTAARRDVDFAMQRSFWRNDALNASADARTNSLRALERVSGPPESEASLAGALARMTESFAALRANPASPVLQTSVIGAARDLAASLNGASDAIQRERNNAHSRMVSLVRETNGALGEIGRLNEAIVRATQAGQTTAELEDRRDEAIRVVARALDARPIPGKDGAVTLVTRNGLTLPLADNALSLQDANIGPTTYPGGGMPELQVNNGIAPPPALGLRDLGGSIGGLMELRDNTLPLRQAELDEIAQKLARRLDQQGLRLFSRQDGTIPVENGVDQTGYVGFAREIQVYPAILATPALLRDGTHTIPGGTPPAFPGGTPNPSPPPGGDPFTPNPPGGPADFDALLDRVLTFALGERRSPTQPHNPVFLTTSLGPDPVNNPLSNGLGTGGNVSLARFVSDVLSRHAVETNRVSAEVERTATARDYIFERIQERSGIDVDREMANMLALQQAYAANAKVISAVQTMWDTLLDAVR
jgi:flagellar hook-associated protein 1 FlgK